MSNQEPSTPESTADLGEPLLEFFKEEPLQDISDAADEQLFEVLVVVEEPKQEPTPEAGLFCFICLRPCTPSQVVEFSTEPSWNCLDVASGRDKLALISGLELELEQSSICRSCWILVETLTDFREVCLKAAAWRARFSYGLDGVEDDWLSTENVEAMEKMRKVVQEHVERIEVAEVESRNRQDSGTDEMSEEKPVLEDVQDWTEEASYSDSPEETPKNDSLTASAEIVDKMEFTAFSCAKCQRKFDTKNGMAIHYKFCINPSRKKPLVPKLHTCSICSANFPHNNRLEEHLNKHTGNKPYKCRKKNCNRRFYGIGDRKKHEHKCKGNNLHVEQDSLESIEENNVPEAKQPETTIYTCNKCPRKFYTVGGLRIHAFRCKGPDENPQLHICTICSMEFIHPKDLEAHMNKHNGIKPYKCKKESCGKHFYGKLELYRHNRTCGREKPICPQCGIQLSSRVTLRAHIETHAAGPTFECETCGKKFKSKKTLKNHQLVHSDQRKYPCGECRKSYKSLYALSVHRRHHTDERPFSCTVCGKGFIYKCLIRPHMEKYHAGRD